jgi:uncharacterized membrane-anchored protein
MTPSTSLARIWLALAAVFALAMSASAQEENSLAGDGIGIEWQEGPTTGRLGTMAEIDVPAGFRFTGTRGTKTLLELTQNPATGRELGTIVPSTTDDAEFWFVVFEYVDSGHVKDEEKDELDADDLLDTLKDGTEAGNEERRKRGWGTVDLVGWHTPPFYDPKTNNLNWATIARAEAAGGAGESVNWSTRLLGRTGYMNVDLVLDRTQVAATRPQFEELLRGFKFNAGQRYAEFRAGDKIAEYGLAALVAGGAGVVAAKTGLLAKFWKVLVVGVVAIAGAFKKLFGFGKSSAPGNDASAS